MTTAATLSALGSNGSIQLLLWTTAGRPTVATGLMGFNTSLSKAEYWNGSSWISM